MSWLDWLRPPRNLLTLYLAGTLAAAAALVWLGWRLLDQERVLEGTRAQERLETAADRVVALLQRSLDDLERQWSAPDAVLSDDTVVLTADGRTIQARPSDRLVFYPFLPEAAEPPRDVFRAGERAEFAGGDPEKAIAIYRALARSKESAVRAGALVGLGRSLRKAGRPDEALRVYADLAGLSDAFIEGLPADLVAREARCTVLQEQGRHDALEREARELHRDLARGRWRLRHALVARRPQRVLRGLPRDRGRSCVEHRCEGPADRPDEGRPWRDGRNSSNSSGREGEARSATDLRVARRDVLGSLQTSIGRRQRGSHGKNARDHFDRGRGRP